MRNTLIKGDPLVLKLWTGGQHQSINGEQHKSVGAALRNKFQLIQGPPGNLHDILYYMINKLVVYA